MCQQCAVKRRKHRGRDRRPWSTCDGIPAARRRKLGEGVERADQPRRSVPVRPPPPTPNTCHRCHPPGFVKRAFGPARAMQRFERTVAQIGFRASARARDRAAQRGAGPVRTVAPDGADCARPAPCRLASSSKPGFISAPKFFHPPRASAAGRNRASRSAPPHASNGSGHKRS